MNCINESTPKPKVHLTERALAQIKSLLQAEPETAPRSLRIYVEGGCCSGLTYGMLFDEPQADDVTQETDGVRVAIDPASAKHLQGVEIDYVEAEEGAGFRIGNTQQPRDCHCGH